MKLSSLTFRGGIHPPYSKELAKAANIELCVEPSIVKILLSQHIGAPCNPLVKVGDKVKVGQKIGESESFVSAPVHSSVSGVVKKIEDIDSPLGNKSKAIIIESDGLNELSEEVSPKGSIESLSAKEIVDIVREAGITGQGGASFPTHVKLSPPSDKKIDTIILNGAECEPFLTADHRLMIEASEDIVFGLKAIMKAVGVSKGYIGIEDNKKDAIDAMISAAESESNIEIVALETKYPQGDEKRIIDAITKRQVPVGGLPMDVGVIVNNVGTAEAIAKAIKTGMPLIERVVTVTGKAIANPKNLLVKIGTPFEDVINHCGGYKGNVGKIIMGGPMMGMVQFTDSVPVVKGTSGILLLSEDEVASPPMDPCMRCGRCIYACPVNIQPMVLGQLSLKGRFEETEKYNIWSCIECGTCSYICPARRPLLHSIRVAKKALSDKQKRESK
jgi:Na+-translocating ferredoxin:NAD+ oxidoreductase subunit C